MWRMAPRIVFRGDDAGCAENANLGIWDCVEAGVLRNVGVMTPGPAFEHAASLFRGVNQIDFGLHVTLNSEWESVKWGPTLPAEEVQSLMDGAFFTQQPAVLQHRGFSVEEAVAEIQAQLEKGRRAGFEFSYIDQHMGVGWIDGLGDRIERLAETEGLHTGEFLQELAPGDSLLARIQNSSDAESYLYVTHPCRDGADVRLFWHEGLGLNQIAHEREEDRRMLIDPNLIAAKNRGDFLSLTFSEAANLAG
jgi:chitin disaccharide deacetylase